MRARIVQCLCPERHCIAAIVAHPNSEDPGNTNYKDDAALIRALQISVFTLLGGDVAALGGTPLPKEIERAIERGGAIRPYCELCGADMAEWRFEIQHTQERVDFAEIMSEITALEEAQKETARLLHATGLSFRARLEAARKASKN